MNIQIYLLIAVVLLGLFFQSKGDNSENRKKYIFVILSLLILESCLRGLSVGSDTLNYYWMFTNCKYETWTEIWQEFAEKYYYTQNADSRDVGFVIFNKIIYEVFPDFSFFLFISALTFFIPLGILLNRYITSFRQLIFAFILYVCLFNPIAMSGVRKEIALGATILAFIFYVDKKYIYVALTLLLGTTIHVSTLLFLAFIAVDVINKKYLRTIHISSFALIPVALAFSGSIIVLMAEQIDSEKYAQYGLSEARGGAATFLFMLEMCSLLCLYAYRKIDFTKNVIIGHFYAMIPLFTFFGCLIMNNGSMIRISQYYHVYLLVLLPYALEYGFPKDGKMVYMLAESVLIGFLLISSGGGNYTFIWNDYLPKY